MAREIRRAPGFGPEPDPEPAPPHRPSPAPGPSSGAASARAPAAPVHPAAPPAAAEPRRGGARTYEPGAYEPGASDPRARGARPRDDGPARERAGPAAAPEADAALAAWLKDELPRMERRIVRKVAGRIWFLTILTWLVLGGLACGLFAVVVLLR
jgi:hypothetical protein